GRLPDAGTGGGADCHSGRGGQPGGGTGRTARPRPCATASARCAGGDAPAARSADHRPRPALWPRPGCQAAGSEGMTDDLDRIMAVMDTAFDPAFGEAWTRRQVGDALAMPGTHYLLAGAGGEAPAAGEPAAGFALSRGM